MVGLGARLLIATVVFLCACSPPAPSVEPSATVAALQVQVEALSTALARSVPSAESPTFVTGVVERPQSAGVVAGMPEAPRAATGVAESQGAESEVAFEAEGAVSPELLAPIAEVTPTPEPTRTPFPTRTVRPTSVADALPCSVGQIKANSSSRIYHVPGGASYSRTRANVVCFDSEDQALGAGYRKARN